MTNDELVGQVCPLINNSGWKYYTSAAAASLGQHHGLTRGELYFIGRGGLLGDCDAAIVSAAFGYFNPKIVTSMWNSAREKVAPKVAGKAHYLCAADFGREKLAEVRSLDGFVNVAEKVYEATDPDGLALFAAFKAEPLVSDLAGRAMQLVAALREFRGSAHLIAIRAMGISTKQAHWINRPNDVKMFGWSEADAPEINESTRERKIEAEKLTDRLVEPAFSVLDGDERKILLEVATSIASAL